MVFLQYYFKNKLLPIRMQNKFFKNALNRIYPVFFIATAIFLGFLTACNTGSKVPDVSDIPVAIDIERFEKDLFSADSTNYDVAFADLERRYPEFMEMYVDQLMSFGSVVDTAKRYRFKLADFIQNQDIRSLYDSCIATYPKLDFLEDDLETTFKYFKHYLPNRPIPIKTVSHISAFGPGVVTYDTTLLGINLDLYLGKDFAFYPAAGLPKYMTHRYEKEYIVPNSLKAWVQNLFPKPQTPNRFIDQIAYEGKLLYLLDKCLPYTHDSLKIGFSGKQLNWCYQEEGEIWAFLIEKELLFSNQSREFIKLLNEAPTSNGMPPESPGRTVLWIGWQMVRKYMAQNPETTLEQLMAIHDGQKILAGAKYKPKK